jgi:zinc D-Ala-D-Ala carboxypeptidase
MAWDKIKYFKPWEFDSPDAPGSGELISEDLVHKLDIIREMYGSPLQINSGVRTVEHNALVGGVDSSAHVEGYAADVRAFTSFQRFYLTALAIQHGIPRIGIGKSFIHLDVDPSKPQRVLWTY